MGRSALHPGLQCTASGVSVHCVRTCSALRPKQSQTHVLAGAVANVCGGGCNALRLRGAKLELKSSVLFWMREKTAP